MLLAEVMARTAHVEPPDFYGAPRVRIDRLYVAPEIALARHDGERVPLTYDEWRATIRRSVVLGNPGAGKSTLAKKLCHDIATRYEDCLLGGRRLVPFIVTLREYGAMKKERPCSISDHIAETIHTRLQLPDAPNLVEYMLLAGRMFIVFDGLDELLDTHYRKEIRADVESFVRRFPNVPVLVTSREVGYKQAPLDGALFSVARLADFDVSRVRDYAQKWFALEEGLSERERIEKADSFVRESNAVADLRSNPLMLALMCNFYKGQNYIPRNRPDVYDKCARMLFDTWDRQRDIKADLPIEEHIEPAMQFLARWIYEDERRQGGVTESELVEQAAAFLSEHRFDDPHKAAHAARAFIEFCRGRAWVFTDTGSTEGGEPLYQFTHRTFLEYFTARYLVATNPTALTLAGLLLPHVESSEWDVIAQLAFHIKARTTIGDADILLTMVLDRAAGAGPALKRAALLAFGGRCLQFLVPKPATARRLVSDTVASLLESASYRGTRHQIDLTDSLTTALGSLMVARAENREVVTESVVKAVKTACETERPEAVELLLTLERPLLRWGPDEHDPTDEILEYWRDVKARLTEECLEQVLTLAAENPSIESAAWRAKIVDTSHFIEHHGVIAALEAHPFILWRRTLPTGIADYVVRAVFVRPPRSPQIDFAAISNALLALRTPWLRRGRQFRLGLMGVRPRLGLANRASREPSGDEWFVAFAVLALRVETMKRRPGGAERGERFLQTMRAGVPRRQQRPGQEPVAALVSILGEPITGTRNGLVSPPGSLSEEQRQLVERWRTGDLALTGVASADGSARSGPAL